MKLIYFSPVPWGSFAQRSHEHVNYFNKVTNGEVLWVDPYPTRLPKLVDLRRPKSQFSKLEINRPDWLQVISVRALPMEPMACGRWLNAKLLMRKLIQRLLRETDSNNVVLGIGKPSALALEVLSRGREVDSYYDAMDDFPAFFSGRSSASMAQIEVEIIKRVKRNYTSSSYLKEKLSKCVNSVYLVKNACNPNLIPEKRGDSHSPIVLGYVGTIGEWFDWDVIKRLSEISPEIRIRIIGPLYNPAKFRLPENVSIEPPLTHMEAMKELQFFTFGLIPFLKTKLTLSVDPIKYYEYRACGLPVLSTDFGEMSYRRKEKGVFLLDEGTDLEQILQKGLSFTAEQDVFRENNSWGSRFDEARLFAP